MGGCYSEPTRKIENHKEPSHLPELNPHQNYYITPVHGSPGAPFSLNIPSRDSRGSVTESERYHYEDIDQHANNIPENSYDLKERESAGQSFLPGLVFSIDIDGSNRSTPASTSDVDSQLHSDTQSDVGIYSYDSQQSDETKMKAINDTHATIINSLESVPFMVDAFQSLVEESIDVLEVVPHLPTIIDDQEFFRIKARDSPRCATRLFLEKIKRSNECGKWQSFIEALQKAGYEYIASLLTGKTEEDHTNYRKLLKILTPVLMNRIYPPEIIEQLYAKEAISEVDKQEIERALANHGAIKASLLLLDKVPRKVTNWCELFLETLKACGMEDVVELFKDPETTDSDTEGAKQDQHETIRETGTEETMNGQQEYICITETEKSSHMQYKKQEDGAEGAMKRQQEDLRKAGVEETMQCQPDDRRETDAEEAIKGQPDDRRETGAEEAIKGQLEDLRITTETEKTSHLQQTKHEDDKSDRNETHDSMTEHIENLKAKVEQLKAEFENKKLTKELERQVKTLERNIQELDKEDDTHISCHAEDVAEEEKHANVTDEKTPTTSVNNSINDDALSFLTKVVEVLRRQSGKHHGLDQDKRSLLHTNTERNTIPNEPPPYPHSLNNSFSF